MNILNTQIYLLYTATLRHLGKKGFRRENASVTSRWTPAGKRRIPLDNAHAVAAVVDVVATPATGAAQKSVAISISIFSPRNSSASASIRIPPSRKNVSIPLYLTVLLSAASYCKHKRVLTTHKGFVNTRVRAPASAAANICIAGPNGNAVFPP
uniref:Uncharacterized protein n=1 Tax=Glossina pallidipes TaxID=7398 RepID=A0A1A9Z7H5_GLOPL